MPRLDLVVSKPLVLALVVFLAIEHEEEEQEDDVGVL